jgi:acyl-CoA synthetase (AMP-forming)/AMP-acid ligase II
VLREGGGLCVGRPPDGLDLEIIAVPRHDGPLDVGEAGPRALRLPPGRIGELLVRGAHVSAGYYRNPEADAAIKVPTAAGQTWHRLGDMGYLDERGRVFLVGRVHDAVEIEGKAVHPLAVEPMIDALPFVSRSGIVGVDLAGRRRLVLAYQPRPTRRRRGDRARQLARIQASCARIGVNPDRVLEVARVPVDARHNGKVDHERLTVLCRRRLTGLGRWIG